MIDWDSLWGQATNAVEQGFNDLQSIGVPALQSAAEQWGINVLTQQHAQTTATLNQNVKALADRPSEEGSFGSYLASAFQNSGVSTFGPQILIGAVAIGILAIVIWKGR